MDSKAKSKQETVPAPNIRSTPEPESTLETKSFKDAESMLERAKRGDNRIGVKVEDLQYFQKFPSAGIRPKKTLGPVASLIPWYARGICK
jgi:hypothetical protein